MNRPPFVFHDGKAAHSIQELALLVEQHTKEEFEEHVNKDRNDFAAWIEFSQGQKELADKLRQSTDRIATIATLREWIKKKEEASFGHFVEQGHQKEFLFGLAVGILLGIILLRIVQVIN
jgi:hypothetical protein